MDNIPLDCSAIGIDAILERFEHDWKGDDLYLRASVEQFGLASNMEGVVELIRADIDRRYAHEREVDLKRYADWFPELRAEPRYLHDVGFEDFRSRKSRGLSLERVRWSWIPQIESCEWYREFKRATSSDRFSVRLADHRIAVRSYWNPKWVLDLVTSSFWLCWVPVLSAAYFLQLNKVSRVAMWH